MALGGIITNNFAVIYLTAVNHTKFHHIGFRTKICKQRHTDSSFSDQSSYIITYIGRGQISKGN